MEGKSSFRFFADHADAVLPFVGHTELEYGSKEYWSTVGRMQKHHRERND